MQKISPFLWFDGQAEEAADFYCSVFKDARKGRVTRYGASHPQMAGKAMTVAFELFGQHYIALNGGPMYQFTQAISFMVHCESQAEVDEYWDTLTADGGKPGRCGWLIDKFGLSWQIIPNEMGELLADKDPAKAQRAMLGMGKIDLEAMRQARDGKGVI